MSVANWSFALLVIFIPIMSGMIWMDHQRTNDLTRQAKDRVNISLAACARVNVLRHEHNQLVMADRKQARILIHYMRLDIAMDIDVNGSSLPERDALAEITSLYRESAARQILPPIDCEKVYRQ